MQSAVEGQPDGGRWKKPRSSFDQPTLGSKQFNEHLDTSTPKRKSSQHRIFTDAGMILSSSRQEFLPGEPASNGGSSIRYTRKGGVFIGKWGGLSIILGTIIFAVVVGLLVYFFAPCRDKEKAVVEDDLSWDIGEIHVRNADDKIRLLTSVVPSYYRLKIKPNFTTFTFEGSVAITLSTHKATVKHISLHSRDLEIFNKTILTEQTLVGNITGSRIRRDVADEPKVELSTEAMEVVSITTNTTIEKTNNETFTSEKITEPIVTTTEKQNVHPERELPKFNMTYTSRDKNRIALNATSPVLSQMKTKRIKIVSKELNPSIDRLVFTLESHLKANANYTLEIFFKGKIDDSLTGFYKSSYRDLTDNTTGVLAVTQFEPTSARKAFPCFDEPHFKARFEISIARTKDVTVLSNMPLIDEEEIPGENLIWSHFERSLPMSSYLVAYAISDLVSINASTALGKSNDVSFQIWTRKELSKQGQYAAEIGPKILNFYETYFGVPYALPKIDLVGIPDFSVGAMENWGLLTFRETSLLIDPDSNSIRAKKGVSMVIAHELAHQWFGNLVTMRWWTDLWLNEGFATYLEYIGVNAIEPSWEMLDQFSLDRMGVMSLDSIQSTRPVSTLVNDETQISQIFDDISYMKAASLLRMLNHILTEEVFHAGLVNYMTKWQFGNADQDDLWLAFTTAANNASMLPDHITVKSLMDSWTLQGGYPVINVTRHYEKGTATLTQNRFYLSKPANVISNELWYVPINYATGNSSFDTWTTFPTAWLEMQQSIMITLPENANTTWTYFNVMGIGHYRVNYDTENWIRLKHALYDTPNKFPIVTRAQLLDDAFSLARAGQLNYSVPLDLTKYMIDEEEEMLPWYAALDNLEFLNLAMQRSTKFGLFQEYISRLISPTLKVFGYIPGDNDTSQSSILRDHLIYWACQIEEPECLDWAWTHFKNWSAKSNPDKENPIPFNSRGTVYSTVLRLGSKKEFDFLYERFEKSNDPEVRTEIISALPSTRNTWQLNSLFEYAITSMDLQLTPILWDGIDSDLAGQLAFKFVSGNWARVHAKYNQVDDQILQHIIDGAFSRIATEQELRQFKRFIQTNKEQLKSVSQAIRKNVERAVLRLQWNKTKMEDVERWLAKFASSKRSGIDEFSTLYDGGEENDTLSNSIDHNVIPLANIHMG